MSLIGGATSKVLKSRVAYMRHLLQKCKNFLDKQKKTGLRRKTGLKIQLYRLPD